MSLLFNILLKNQMAQWLNNFDVKTELTQVDFFTTFCIQFSNWLLSIGTMYDAIPLILHSVNL